MHSGIIKDYQVYLAEKNVHTKSNIFSIKNKVGAKKSIQFRFGVTGNVPLDPLMTFTNIHNIKIIQVIMSLLEKLKVSFSR